MEIVYITTHLVMAICIISILYATLKSYSAINDPEKLSVADRFYVHGLKLIGLVVIAGYRIAAGIFISYIK